MKKGFTLVELLAVIVILALIALIATPIILNIIKESKEESNQRSVDMYAKALKSSIAKYQLDGKKIKVSELYTENGKDFKNAELKVDYDGNVVCDIIEINNDGNVYLDRCKVNGSKKEYTYGNREFIIKDDWKTIINNVISGKGNLYKVGQVKELDLGTFGKHNVRISNISINDKCKETDFSQTACGFVLELSDIIELKQMNLEGTTTNDWKNSNLRKYINEALYNSIPEEIRLNIIDTKVITGSSDINTTNYETIDKLYLLSAKEVYGDEGISDDTAKNLTRQLDYYIKMGVNQNNSKSAIKKYNGEVKQWWLRTPYSYGNNNFYIVNNEGSWSSSNSISSELGISISFRIG